MKKGCFIKLIIFLTILTAVILYIAQNHFDELILEPGKGIMKNFVPIGSGSELDEEFNFVKNTPEKDSLKILISGFIDEELNRSKKISNKQFEWLVDSVSKIINDSIIDSQELHQLKEFINYKSLNERPKKN